MIAVKSTFPFNTSICAGFWCYCLDLDKIKVKYKFSSARIFEKPNLVSLPIEELSK